MYPCDTGIFHSVWVAVWSAGWDETHIKSVSLTVCTQKDNFTVWPTCLMCSRNCFLSPVYSDVGGPLRIELACFLSSSSEDRHRAKTDSPISVTGIPYSRPATAVHFPVPFCPAESLIFSKRYEPVE